MDFSPLVVSPERRQSKINKIASCLQNLNPDRTDFEYFLDLAQKFEHKCYTNADSFEDYQQRIERRLRKAQRAQESSASSDPIPMSIHDQSHTPTKHQPIDMTGATPNHTFNSITPLQKQNGDFQDTHTHFSQFLSVQNPLHKPNIGMVQKSDAASTGRFPQRNSCTDSGFSGNQNINDFQSNAGNRSVLGNLNLRADMPFSEIPEPIPFNNCGSDGIPDPIPFSNGQPEICGYEKLNTAGFSARNMRTDSSQSNSWGVDSEAHSRRLRVLEMKSQHAVALESFRRKSSHIFKVKERSGQKNARHLEKLKKLILYATKTLSYLEKCENGHFPSEQALVELKDIISKILGFNKMIEGAISKHKITQQVSKSVPHPNQKISNPASQPQQFQQQCSVYSLHDAQVEKSNNRQYHCLNQQSEQNRDKCLAGQCSSEFDFGFNHQQSNMNTPSLSSISQMPKGNISSGIRNTRNLGTDGHANQRWQSNRPSFSQQNSQQQPIINVTVNVSNIQQGGGSVSDSSKAPQQVNISYQPNSNFGNVTNANLARLQSLESMDHGSISQSSTSLKFTAQNNDEFNQIKTFLQFDPADEKIPTIESQPSFELSRSRNKIDPQLAKKKSNSTSIEPVKLKNETSAGQQYSVSQQTTQQPFSLFCDFQPSKNDGSSIYREQNKNYNSIDLKKNGKTGWTGTTHPTTEVSLPENLTQLQNPMKVKSEYLQEIKATLSSKRTVLSRTMQISGRNVNISSTSKGKQPPSMFFECSDARFSHSHLEPPLKKYKISFTNPASGALQVSAKFDGSLYNNDATQLAYFLSQHFLPVSFQTNPSGNSIFFDCDGIITVHIIFEQIKQVEATGPKIGQPLSVSIVRKGEGKEMPSNFAEDSLMKKILSEQHQFAFSKHSYFKKITAHAIQMLMFFLSKHSNMNGIVLFCEWMYSYCKKHEFEQGHAVMHSLHFDYESQSVLPPYLRSVEGVLFSPEELF